MVMSLHSAMSLLHHSRLAQFDCRVASHLPLSELPLRSRMVVVNAAQPHRVSLPTVPHRSPLFLPWLMDRKGWLHGGLPFLPAHQLRERWERQLGPAHLSLSPPPPALQLTDRQKRWAGSQPPSCPADSRGKGASSVEHQENSPCSVPFFLSLHHSGDWQAGKGNCVVVPCFTPSQQLKCRSMWTDN